MQELQEASVLYWIPICLVVYAIHVLINTFR